MNSDYTLVRKSREGRQDVSEEIHLIGKNKKETVCGKLESKELCTVRTLSIYFGDTKVCSDCSKKLQK